MRSRSVDMEKRPATTIEVAEYVTLQTLAHVSFALPVQNHLHETGVHNVYTSHKLHISKSFIHIHFKIFFMRLMFTVHTFVILCTLAKPHLWWRQTLSMKLVFKIHTLAFVSLNKGGERPFHETVVHKKNSHDT